MTGHYDKDEHREHLRCPALTFTATVQKLNGLQRFSKPYTANIIDFHRFGAGLCAARKIAVGNKIRLTIKSSTEEVSNISAVVCHVRTLSTGYWFGIRFTRSATDKSGGQSVLAGLENMIKERLS